MTADKLRSYRFSTQAQWDSCLLAQATRDSGGASGGLRPFAPYAQPATLYESNGAHAPAVTRAGEILWCDDAGTLHWLSAGENPPETVSAPMAMARAARIVPTSSGFWVMGDPPESLQRYEETSLTRLVTVDLQTAHLVDIASDGRDSIWALVEREGSWQSVRVDRNGHVTETVTFTNISHPKAFLFLRHSQRFVVLAGEPHSRLYWFRANGEHAFFSLAVAAMHPCFSLVKLPCVSPRYVFGSDSRERIFLAGKDGDEFGGGAYVLIFDADGSLIGDVPLDPLDAPPTGLAATRESLFVTGQRGLLRFDAAEVVPEGTEPARCTLITPMLHSPDREDQRRWLRVEATTRLPEGSTIEISYAATDDIATRDRLKALAADDTMPAGQRVSKLLSEPDLWRNRTGFHGTDGAMQGAKTPFSAKLFDVREAYLWVCITLSAAAGARLPVLSELAVLYPGRTLMENLPAIYQREEARPDSFLRGLVGVLETTTQGLDTRIASMGGRIHPSTAPEPWLDFIARWLGVPWDDGLNLEQKRAVVMRATDLAKKRGTRAGLEVLLESLIPGTPHRFLVVDAAADFGFAIVGGEAYVGSALPAMLGGHTRWSAELDSQTVLGSMRLPCEGQREDGAWQLAGKVRVDVAATAPERKAWEPWLLALITEMIPVIARVELRWVTAQALLTNRLDGTLALASAPVAHLGTDALTGLARLPERGIRLAESGPSISTPLR